MAKELTSVTASRKHSQALSESTAKAVFIEAMLHSYYHEKPVKPVWAQIISNWLSALEPFSVDEVEKACRAWVIEEPSKRPNEGHIRAELGKVRARQFREANPIQIEASKKRVTQVQAEAILQGAGFAPRRMPT